MELGDEDKTKDTGAEPEEFDFTVASDAASKIVGDFLVKNYNENAGCKDGDTTKKVAPIESPKFHGLIIA